VHKYGGLGIQEPAETNGGHLQAASAGKIPGPAGTSGRIHFGVSLLSKKGSKKELTKRPPFLVKSLVCKSSEKTVNGG
jgi:hypothetical protein